MKFASSFTTNLVTLLNVETAAAADPVLLLALRS